MKFKGQGKINICGFEYKKNIADSRRGGFRAPKKNPVSAPESTLQSVVQPNAGRFVDKTFCIRRFIDKLGRFVDRCINRSDTWF